NPWSRRQSYPKFNLAMERLNARSLLTWVAPVTLLPVSLCHPAVGSPLSITVHSFDYSSTHPASMAEAQRVAELIFLHAGIHVFWLNCPIARPHSVAAPNCEPRTDAAHFVLAVLPEHMARKVATNPTQFGLALLNREGGLPNYAYVFLQRAVDMAKSELVSWTGILGHLIAHELGHLLLGRNSHVPVGIMRAAWRSTEIKQALTGNLLFTPKQVERIRDDVQRRLQAR
ncbi:MAG: hypothetical protein ACRD7E_05125, partial [Bryobacteraceae bacterium]